jgi:hypothetical protein
MARSIPTFLPTTPNDALTGKVGRPLLGLVARPASLRHQSVEMRRPVRTLRWKPGFHFSFIIRLRSVAVSASLMDFRTRRCQIFPVFRGYPLLNGRQVAVRASGR